MSHYLHYHLRLHRLHYTEMNELYASLTLRAFAFGLVGIFVPIYIYNLGFSIAALAIFFIIDDIFRTIMYAPAAKLVARFGPKHLLIASYLLTFGYTILLFLLPESRWLLYPTAAFAGVGAAMFWMACHIDTATVINAKRPTSEYGWIRNLTSMAAALAPLVGGLIASTYGIQYTLLGAAFGLLVAVYPLLKTLEPAVPQRDVRLPLFKTAPRRHLAANFAMNFQSSVAILLWPLFIFLVVMSYESVGIIASASLLLLLVVTWVIGRLGDRGKNSQVLKIGSGSRSVVHLARAFTGSFAGVLGVNMLGDVTDALAAVPYSVRFYEAARRSDIAAYLVDMEIVGGFGKTAAWIAFLIATFFVSLPAALIITFVLAAAATPFLRLIEPA